MFKKNQSETGVSTLGFLKYFQRLLGYKFYVYIVLNIIVGLLDGLGLAMFIPLLGIATGNEETTKSLGNLDFIPMFFKQLGVPLTLVSVLFVMISLFTLKAIITYIKQLFFIRLRLLALKKIRFDLIDHLRSLSYTGYTTSDPGKIQFNMVGETSRLVQAMSSYLRVIQYIVIVVTYIALAVFTNWQFAILVIIGAVISNLIYIVINRFTKLEAKKLSGFGNLFNSYLIQSIQNFKYLKATNSFERYEKKLKSSIHKFEWSNYRIGKLNAIAEALREPLIIIVISIMLIIQMRVLHGDADGILVSLLFFYRGLTYLVAMQNQYNHFLGNSAAVDALEGLKNDFSVHREPKQISETEFDNLLNIELNEVSVRFSDVEILKKISLRINEKETIALVGESGAGKTTLANVISGLIAPTLGSIIVNGNELAGEQLNIFRNKIGYITQEPVIFDDTIYNNITFWAEKTQENLKKFEKCIELVHLKKFLGSLAAREDTELGNSGILISGGQKQRISIARELFRDVDLLIMDEATSALDSETEHIIKENIENLHGQYMMVIIAHRLSTIKHVDTIYLMEDGHIIHQGNYAELMNKSKKFVEMVELQEV